MAPPRWRPGSPSAISSWRSIPPSTWQRRSATRPTRKVHRDSTVTLDGVLFELPSTLIGERVVLRYDPTLQPANRRQFVLHRGRLADLRLDPAGDDEPDAASATGGTLRSA